MRIVVDGEDNTWESRDFTIDFSRQSLLDTTIYVDERKQWIKMPAKEPAGNPRNRFHYTFTMRSGEQSHDLCLCIKDGVNADQTALVVSPGQVSAEMVTTGLVRFTRTDEIDDQPIKINVELVEW